MVDVLDSPEKPPGIVTTPVLSCAVLVRVSTGGGKGSLFLSSCRMRIQGSQDTGAPGRNQKAEAMQERSSWLARLALVQHPGPPVQGWQRPPCWALPHQSPNQENAPQACPQVSLAGTFSQLKFLLP